jgi:FkbM family methyltransferase
MIFIEVGAHRGQSYEIAKNPKFGFDEFWLIEPSSFAFKYLKRISDKKVRIFNFGLGDLNASTKLYRSGARGASLFKEKFQILDSRETETIEVRRASDFLEKVLSTSEVYIRINCEGSEVKILSDLLDSNLLNSNHSILVDFDIIRFSKEYSVESLRQRLGRTGVRIYDENFFGEKYNEKSVLRWLEFELRDNFTRCSFYNLVEFKLKLHLPFRTILYRFFARFIPVRLRILIMRILFRIKRSKIFRLIYENL